MNISLRKPQNQAPIAYGTDPEWNAFREAVQRIPKGFDVPMIIGGEEVRSPGRIESVDPSTGEVLCTTQKATADHTRSAVDAALRAKDEWAALPPENRIQKFRDLEHLLYERRHEICAAASVECGYVPIECSVSWAEMMDFIRFNPWYYLQLLRVDMGDGIGETNTMRLRALKGFTCAMTPFNFPIAIGYNLPTVMALCGNTVVWKPSSDAPLTSWLLMRAVRDAGFPPGVINMITGPGSETVPPILKHPELLCINFTGSYDTAKLLASELYSKNTERWHFPRLVAETGGKDFLIADRAIDVWDTAASIIAGAFGRSGQKCSATSLLCVDRKIWPDLKAAILEQMKSFRVGVPYERGVNMGPVINRGAYENIMSFVQRGKADAKVSLVLGGNGTSERGYYVEPTMFEVDADRHELLSVEIFGPVLAVKVYDHVDEAVSLIRGNTYRLTGAVCSQDEVFLAKYVPILSELAGNFYVNRKTTGAVVDQQPFGGDGASGTNYKAGGLWYLLQFVSQASVTRRHARTPVRPGIWNWLEGR